jgi:hypothetical protein
MIYHYLNISGGRVVGFVSTNNKINSNNVVEINEQPTAKHLGMVWDGANLLTKPISEVIDEKIQLIKSQAADRIGATDWQVERAKERAELLNKNPMADADYRAVLKVREDIRSASDAAELAVSSLTTNDEVDAFTW